MQYPAILPSNGIEQKKIYKEVGMVCQEVCKHVRSNLKVKVVYKTLSIPTSFAV